MELRRLEVLSMLIITKIKKKNWDLELTGLDLTVSLQHIVEKQFLLQSVFKVNVESKKERLGERSLSGISLLLLIYMPYASSCTFTQDDFIWIDNWNIKKVTTVFAHCEASITAACHPLLSSLLSWAVWMQYKETKLALSFFTTVLKSTIHNHAQFPSLKAIQQLLASPFSLVACKMHLCKYSADCQ